MVCINLNKYDLVKYNNQPYCVADEHQLVSLVLTQAIWTAHGAEIRSGECTRWVIWINNMYFNLTMYPMNSNCFNSILFPYLTKLLVQQIVCWGHLRDIWGNNGIVPIIWSLMKQAAIYLLYCQSRITKQNYISVYEAFFSSKWLSTLAAVTLLPLTKTNKTSLRYKPKTVFFYIN